MKSESRFIAITMIMILMVSFAFAGQNAVVAQSDSEDAMFTASEDGALFTVDVSIPYVLVQPSFNGNEQADDTEYRVFQGHADIGTEDVSTTLFMSVLKVPTFMLTSERRTYNLDQNSGEMTSEAMRPKQFTLPET